MDYEQWLTCENIFCFAKYFVFFLVDFVSLGLILHMITKMNEIFQRIEYLEKHRTRLIYEEIEKIKDFLQKKIK